MATPLGCASPAAYFPRSDPMKACIAIILGFCLGVAALASAQNTDNAVYVKQFPGATIGLKLTAAQATCNPNAAIPCYLVIDPSLVAYAAGTFPTLCTSCVLLDYRAGNPYAGPSSILNVGSLNARINPAACGTAAAPSWCSGSTLDAWIVAALIGPCGATPSLNVFPQCTIVVPSSSTPYTWASTVTIPAPTTTEQVQFALIFDRGAVANVTDAVTGDAILVPGGGFEGTHVLLEGLHFTGGASMVSTAAAIHVQSVYSVFIDHPIMNGFRSSSGILIEGGGAEIDKPSIGSAHNCVMLKSTASRQPNAVHINGGEFDGCVNGWYHNDAAKGAVHVGQANSIENVLFEGVTNPVIDTASEALRISSNYMEAYAGTAIALGSTQNATNGAQINGNYLQTTKGPSITFVNVVNSVIESSPDFGTYTVYISQSGGSAGNAIVGRAEGVTVTTGGALGTGSPLATCDTADGFRCNSSFGVVKLVTGTTPTAGDAFQIAWVTPFSTPPVCIFQTISGSLALNSDAIWLATTSVKAFTGIAPSGTIKVAYHCGN
jgi:hypothetical protein